MRKVIILGAAGRDFHNFNVVYRDNPAYDVVAFTATQIPGIADRTYPAELAGARYPQGIPIVPEADLAALVSGRGINDVVFAYSDATHEHVMHLASAALAAGASFTLLGPRDTMLASDLPVVAVVAARTGAGKSTISRYLMAALKAAGRQPVAVRHPMPYGALTPTVERYETPSDVAGADISVEAMEEYHQHVAEGSVVYAGVDYARVLHSVQGEADVIVWDGGNNDMPFIRPDVTLTVLDPMRPRQGASYFPGEANVRAADVLVVNKVNAATREAVSACIAEARNLNARAQIIAMASAALVDRPELVRGRKVLVVDDGPSLTHGGLPDGAAGRAARELGAQPVDPRPYAVGSIARAFTDYPHIASALPALGYSKHQLHELAQSIERTPCDAVLLGTPAPLERLIDIRQPIARAVFHARDVEGSSLASAVRELLGM
ncbi:MAG: GTPase [Burkholderiales bacterium]|nr:GTPase [Burkholderiales bacterium]